MISVVVVTHGDFGRSLLKTAEAMVGKQEDVVTVEIPPGEPLGNVVKRCQEVLNKVGAEAILVLVDMVGGTPCNVMLPLVKDKEAGVLTGLNLSMLLTALVKRKSLNLQDLVEQVMKNGRQSVANAKVILQEKWG